MTPSQQAAKIVEEFEIWLIKISKADSYPIGVRQSWSAGAISFAANHIARLYRAGDFGWLEYRDQLDEIRDRVLPVVEMEETK